jgi:hypothetical protein
MGTPAKRAAWDLGDGDDRLCRFDEFHAEIGLARGGS